MKKYKKIQNKNNQREKQLRTENKEAYQNIILYLRGANINIYQQELIRCLWQYKNTEDCNAKVHSLATKKGLVSCPIIL